MKKVISTLSAFILMFAGCFNSCQQQKPVKTTNDSILSDVMAEMPLKTINPPVPAGSIERYGSKIGSIIPEGNNLEIVAEGFIWSEGPVWLPEQKKILFSDVPKNVIYQWSATDGVSLYLDSTGIDGPPVSIRDFIGSNGLLLDPKGNLVICQHGNRRIVRMNASFAKPKREFITLVDNFNGKRLNSPNDAVYNSKGDLYFTDPPYGFPSNGDLSAKELDFQGVYKLSASGELTLIDDKLSRPNGIGLSPDEKTLYVANSDSKAPVWTAYSLNTDGVPVNKWILYDASEIYKSHQNMGLPDGLKVSRSGILFCTGPGGIYVISPEGELLGMIITGHANGNCTFDDNESTLYIAADMYLMRLKLR